MLSCGKSKTYFLGAPAYTGVSLQPKRANYTKISIVLAI